MLLWEIAKRHKHIHAVPDCVAIRKKAAGLQYWWQVDLGKLDLGMQYMGLSSLLNVMMHVAFTF